MHLVWEIDGVVRQEDFRVLPKQLLERDYIFAAQASQLRFALCHPIGSFTSPDRDNKSSLVAVTSCRLFWREHLHPFHKGAPKARIIVYKSDRFNADFAQSSQSLPTHTSGAE